MTQEKLRIGPYPLGARREAGGICFSFVSREENCGIMIYDRASGRKLKKIPFGKEERIGNIHYKWVDVDAASVAYQFYEGERLVPDPHAKVFVSKGTYGHRREDRDLRAGFLTDDFNWGNDRNPRIPYEECFCYCMHVRGFTRHPSSGVENRGTFLGITEKLSYLKRLGVTTVELQPAYEFLEMPTKEEIIRQIPSVYSQEAEKEENTLITEENALRRINYWGYKKGFYYAPKEGYAAGPDASFEFKEMVKQFHSNGMEVIMQFYFPGEIADREIPEILRYWVLEYHVDGFHLMGERLPVNMIAADAALADTKLWYCCFDTEAVYGEDTPRMRNLADYKDDYLYDMRRFLKGDEGMTESVLYHMRHNPDKKGCLNYMSNYYGFTLMDMVSYNTKHNEDNGEDNRDGSDYNGSWNCGTEGRTRKKQILGLRRKQIRNAMCMLFFSQGTPLIFMGDEFGNSQRGNNNPYCQDNETAWLNWKDLEKNRDLYSFMEKLVSLRKEHPILRQGKELRIMDYLSCGYPDLSYHGEAAWRPALDYNSRQVGIMYCGKYARRRKGEEDNYFYIALNMHWAPHKFAMPKLPKGMKWELLLETDTSLSDTDSDISTAAGDSVRQEDPAGERTQEGAAPGSHPDKASAHKESGNDKKGYQDTEENWLTRNVPPRSVAVYVSRSAGSDNSDSDNNRNRRLVRK